MMFHTVKHPHTPFSLQVPKLLKYQIPPQTEKWQEIKGQKQRFLQVEMLRNDRKRTQSLLVITRSKQGARIEHKELKRLVGSSLAFW